MEKYGLLDKIGVENRITGMQEAHFGPERFREYKNHVVRDLAKQIGLKMLESGYFTYSEEFYPHLDEKGLRLVGWVAKKPAEAPKFEPMPRWLPEDGAKPVSDPSTKYRRSKLVQERVEGYNEGVKQALDAVRDICDDDTSEILDYIEENLTIDQGT